MYRLLVAIGLAFANSVPARAADEGTDFFEAKVRPVLVAHCYECHSSAAKKTKGGLALDTRDGGRKGGDSGPAIVPSQPAESLLLKAVKYGDANLQMPPKGKLPDAVIADLEKWIVQGATDPRTGGGPIAMTAEQAKSWWAFQPLRPRAPPVSGHPIDAFIHAKLKEKGLSPAPPADPRTLARRMYLDLWGLPPTPAQVNQFVATPIENRKSIIEELLKSPFHGERYARHWLDVARFAESSGYEHDNDRPHAWPYRDFVVEAFRRDLPFDKFVQWQVAGDELAPEEPLALKATGFLAAGLKNGQVTEREAEALRYEEFDDWVGTIGTSFLGLTVGCARCHDHKFDAIAAKDYYRLAAHFTETVRANLNVWRDWPAARQATLAHLWTFDQRKEARRRHEENLVRLADKWRAANPEPPAPPWLTMTASEAGTGKTRRGLRSDHDLERQEDGSYLFTRLNGDVGPITFTARTSLANIRYLRLEALADLSLPNYGPGFGNHGNCQVSLSLSVAPADGTGKPKSIKLEKVATTTGDKPGGASWGIDGKHAGHDQAAVFQLAETIGDEHGRTLTVTLRCPGDSPSARQTIGKFRIAICCGDSDPAPTGIAMDHNVYERGLKDLFGPQLTPDVIRLYFLTNAEWRRLDAAVDQARREFPLPSHDMVFGVSDRVPPYRMMIQGPDVYEETYYLKRGDINRKEGVVQPGVLPVLWRGTDYKACQPDGATTSHRRSALARWMTDVDHGAGALVARVIVNRLWQHHFGRGLVGTPSDFGAQGDKPTHPELLDWLAAELVKNNWSLHHIHRLIVTSATYQQASDPRPECAKVDPDNQLLWRFMPRRLEAEAIRDSMLAVSGRLDPKVGGPGTLDEASTRRSIYFTVKRSKLIPSLVQLDWPEGLVGVGRRSNTTVPPQALWALNNPQVRACAEAVARRWDGLKDEDIVTRAYDELVARPPNAAERAAAVAFLRTPAGASETKIDFAHAMLMLTEFWYIR